MGSGTKQMGLRLEGVSIHDSGKWALQVRAGSKWATAFFHIDVELTISTDTSTPFEVEVSSRNFEGKTVLTLFRLMEALKSSLI